MFTRRSLFKSLLSVAALAPLAKVSSLSAKTMEQIKKKMLKTDSKTAKRLKYVAKAEEAKGNKKYKAGSMCGNCKFYKADKKNPTWGKCSMAGNKYVETAGWCKSYRADKKKMKKA